MSDPRPPSGDPLAAEIAAHQGCSCLADRGRHCLACGEPWKPCLVRRLADREAARLADREAALLADREAALLAALLRYGVHLHYACELQDGCDCGLDAVRALAPADGEQPA